MKPFKDLQEASVEVGAKIKKSDQGLAENCETCLIRFLQTFLKLCVHQPTTKVTDADTTTTYELGYTIVELIIRVYSRQASTC